MNRRPFGSSFVEFSLVLLERSWAILSGFVYCVLKALRTWSCIAPRRASPLPSASSSSVLIRAVNLDFFGQSRASCGPSQMKHPLLASWLLFRGGFGPSILRV
ncbi:hypothetical protein HanIR_Chr02g0072761 [Helianthus annuus]|nr:hypothetical protein HanIR_Chr02g0072761 [Helianthus annuus]